ncbi:MAG: hypothetical protein ACFFC6_06745 [Promethearchaeota archaeon]
MDIIYISILLWLILIAFWAINSYRFKQDSESYVFEKAKTEYFEPPRPHSESYNNFLKLTSSEYVKVQEKLPAVLAQLIKGYLEAVGYSTVNNDSIDFSENLKLLLTDPDEWFFLQLNIIDFSNLPRNDELAKRYIQILDEVEQTLGISLFSQ